MSNSSWTMLIDANELLPKPITLPFYHYTRPSFIPFLTDEALSLWAPVVAYWSLSLVFHYIDISTWTWLEPYRIHESKEVTQRNRATRSDVVRAVIIQQVVQTAVGFVWLAFEGVPPVVPHVDAMRAIAPWLARLVVTICGEQRGIDLLRRHGPHLVSFTYWWAIPVAQFVFAMFVLDTWQYFLHRAFHANQWLYRHVHSVHHRLYVPYAFGSLYNHPLEGFLLDTLGAVVAQAAGGLNIRQTCLFFALSSLKTVDDHCGYALPFDPLQFLFGNNAEYHDIHHQMAGIKANYSQPFFIHWDTILGTRMRRSELDARRAKKVDGKEL